jgi:hypothetical protein
VLPPGPGSGGIDPSAPIVPPTPPVLPPGPGAGGIDPNAPIVTPPPELTGADAIISDINQTLNNALSMEQLRQISYAGQTPLDAYRRMGLQGQLVSTVDPNDPTKRIGVSQSALSPFAQGILQQRFYNTLMPQYLMSLAESAVDPSSALMSAAGMPITTFEQFVGSSLPTQRLDPMRAQRGKDAIIKVLQNQQKYDLNPYGLQLQTIFGKDPTQSDYLIPTLASPMLSQIAPYLRYQATQNIAQNLRDFMTVQPERSALSLFAGDRTMANPNYLATQMIGTPIQQQNIGDI